MANHSLEKTAVVDWNASTEFWQKPFNIWSLLPLVCLILVGLSVLALTEVTVTAKIYWSDQEQVFLALNSMLSEIPSSIWANITLFGDAAVLLPVMSLLLIKHPKAWVAIIYAAPLAGIASTTMKKLFDTPRPAAVLDPHSFTIVGDMLQGHNSLPSGHTITIFVAIISVLCFLFPSPYRLKHKLVIFAGLSVAAIVGLSRVAVGAHWPLDVLLGAGLGALAAIIGSHFASKKAESWKMNISKRLIASLLPVCLSSVLIYRTIFSGSNEPILFVAIVFGILASAFLLTEQRQRKMSVGA